MEHTERDMGIDFRHWRAAHPDGRHMMVIMDRGGLDEGDMHIRTIAIPVHMQGQGLARAAMAEILRLSDELGIDVTLEASEDGECGHWLQDWYGKLGFVYHDSGMGEYGPFMVRPAAPLPALNMT